MSKTISSHNLAQLDYIIQEIEKNIFITKMMLVKADDLIDEEEQFNIALKILYDNILNAELLLSDLKTFDSCIRSETDFNPDGDKNE